MENLYIGDSKLLAIAEVRFRDVEHRRCDSLVQIWRNIDLDTHLFREAWSLWVRARDQDTAIRQKNSL